MTNRANQNWPADEATELHPQELDRTDNKFYRKSDWNTTHACPTCGGDCRCSVPIAYCVHCA